MSTPALLNTIVFARMSSMLLFNLSLVCGRLFLPAVAGRLAVADADLLPNGLNIGAAPSNCLLSSNMAGVSVDIVLYALGCTMTN
jgi:hypothetical protein